MSPTGPVPRPHFRPPKSPSHRFFGGAADGLGVAAGVTAIARGGVASPAAGCTTRSPFAGDPLTISATRNGRRRTPVTRNSADNTFPAKIRSVVPAAGGCAMFASISAKRSPSLTKDTRPITSAACRDSASAFSAAARRRAPPQCIHPQPDNSAPTTRIVETRKTVRSIRAG